MTEWTDFYDGALHPDDSDPRDHDDVHPVAWRERIADQRRVSSGDAPAQTEWLSDAEAIELMTGGDVDGESE